MLHPARRDPGKVSFPRSQAESPRVTRAPPLGKHEEVAPEQAVIVAGEKDPGCSQRAALITMSIPSSGPVVRRTPTFAPCPDPPYPRIQRLP